MIEYASGIGPATGDPPDRLVSRETAIRARRYVQEFLFPHACYVYGTVMAHGIGHEHAKWIAGFLLAYERTSVRARDIMRAYGALGSIQQRGALMAAMATLEAMDWVKAVASNNSARQEWKVNPAVHKHFAERAKSELHRRLAVRATIAQEGAARAAEKAPKS